MQKKSSRRQKQFNKKKLLIVGLVIFVLGLGILALEKSNTTDFIDMPGASDTAADEGPSPEEKAQEDAFNAEQKQKLIEQEAQTPAKPSEEPTPAPAAPDTGKQSIDLSAKKESNNTVTVITKLYNYSGGSCTLTVTNNGQTKTQTAPAMYQPEYTSCAGFSVPVSDLGTGTWNINLKVISNGATTTKTLTYEVE